ncbi:hypothetical protein ACHAQA_001612 [Verticillium albo-atrum]
MAPSQHGYCDADGGAMTSDAFGRCLDCVKVGGEHHFLSNFLVALDAGCQQRPAPGKLIGLNDTIFSATAIEAIDPTSLKTTDPDAKPLLGLPAIVGIGIGGFVLLLLASGCGYMHFRKRKARREGRSGPAKGGRRHRPASSLSFRCQTHLTPKSPSFFLIQEEEIGAKEKPFADPAAALNSNPISSSLGSWNQSSSSIPHTQVWPGKTPQGHSRDNLSLSTAIPPNPPQSHSSFYRPSPTDYTTPTSTTSTRSTTALLPVHHARRTTSYGASAPPRPPRSPATESYASPVSGTTASPLIMQGTWPPPVSARQDAAIPPPPPRQPHPQGQVLNILLGRESIAPVAAQKRGPPAPLGGGSPTESRTLQTSFPPPPSPGRKR